MIEISLPIYHHTEDTASLRSAGLDYKYEDCVVREVIFYNIDSICTDPDDPTSTIVIVGDNTFICSYNKSVVRDIISKAISNSWFELAGYIKDK